MYDHLKNLLGNDVLHRFLIDEESLFVITSILFNNYGFIQERRSRAGAMALQVLKDIQSFKDLNIMD